MTGIETAVVLIKIALVFFVVLTAVAYLTYAERRISAIIQDRVGPNRVGPFGLLQPLADGIKFIFKEDIVPDSSSRLLYIAAPVFALVTALTALVVIPIGEGFETSLFGLVAQPVRVDFHIADINVGLLYVLAIGSLGVYGIVLGGWASNSKYSLLGGLRGAAQMISYELALGLSIIGVIAIVGSLRLGDVIEAQQVYWFIFLQPMGFLVFIIAAFAETNRLPFDLPEAETEIVAGYHTEYSSMKFAMFFMAEYTHMIVASCMITAIFLGGWYPLPFFGWFGIDTVTHWYLPPLVFIGKVVFLLFLFIWIRWTLPRFRYDQIMKLGWKVLFPLAVANLIITSILILSGVL